MKVEVFTAGCKLCTNVESQVKEVAGNQHEVVIYNLNDENHSSEYNETANKYGVNSVPTVVVDGKLLGCCNSGGFDKSVLSVALS